MATNSKIEWTDHTVNFWWGCTKVSPACAHCYAETMARQRSKMFFGFLVEWGKGKPRGERLEKAAAECWALDTQAMRKGVRYKIFVNSMSDWLDGEVAMHWRYVVLKTVWKCRHLVFQLLTKRPGDFFALLNDVLRFAERAGDIEFVQWLARWIIDKRAPENVWIGTTVESQEWADRRVPALLKIPAVVRFLSCEPMVGAVDLENVYIASDGGVWDVLRGFDKKMQCPISGSIDWVIAGGESGGQARALHPSWVKSLRDQCRAAGVPFFFKQWGEWIPQLEKRVAALPDDKRLKWHKHEDGTLMLRLGTGKAGAVLDGREWREMPGIQATADGAEIAEG